MLKAYNQWDIEQIEMCTVKVRYKDKSTKYRFFVVPGYSPTPIGIPDIELLNILRITCDVRSKPHESRKFNSLKKNI